MQKPKHSEHPHVKLPSCGCKCCVTPLATVTTDPEGLAEFHAYIHRAQAEHDARPRLTGDGRNPGGELFTANNVQPISPLSTWRSRFIGGGARREWGGA